MATKVHWLNQSCVADLFNIGDMRLVLCVRVVYMYVKPFSHAYT